MSLLSITLSFCVIQIDVHINSYFYIANAHRVFVTKELTTTSPVMSPTAHSNLTGIVSIVDSAFLFFHLPPPQKTIGTPLLLTLVIFFFVLTNVVLSLFARIAKIPNIDPTQMQRHRRASSSSTTSSDRGGLSRSSSTTSIRQSPSILASTSPSLSPIESARNSVTAMVLDPLQIVAVGGASQRQEKRRSVI